VTIFVEDMNVFERPGGDKSYEWQVLETATDIPSGENDWKNPSDYADIVEPPRLEHSGIQIVALYAWNAYHGILAKWEVTVEKDTITYVHAEVIDVLVGSPITVRTEGFMPSAGQILLDTEVSKALP
jgi:hypothetical protein